MREILFRGLCLDGDMWYRGYYVKCLTTKRTFMLDTGEITDTALFMDYAIEVIPETIGQYTGLKDKNGTKIFEGDLIDFGYEHDFYPLKITYEIDVVQGSFCFYDGNGYFEVLEGIEQGEIVGNIHENKEMLK